MVNVVRDTHPDRAAVTGWFLAHGFPGTEDGRLRKQVGDRARDIGQHQAAAPGPAGPSRRTTDGGRGTTPSGTGPPPGRRADDAAPAADLGPGHEESGGYVDPEQHRY